MYQPTVLSFVGIALGAEANHGGILLIRDDAHNAVGDHGVLVQHKGDGLPDLDGVGVYLFYIDQRTGVIGRFHGSGQHGEYLQAHDPCAHQQQRQNHHQRNQNTTDHIPDFFK